MLLRQELQVALQVALVLGHVYHLRLCLEWHRLLTSQEVVLATRAVGLLAKGAWGCLSRGKGVS